MSLDLEELELRMLVPLGQSRVRYVLEWKSQAEEDGVMEIMALVVMKRDAGFLLALPAGALPEEDLVVVEGGVVGPSTVISASALLPMGAWRAPLDQSYRF